MDIRIGQTAARLAKLSIPSSDRALLRNRLLRHIEGAAQAIWVGAPAGAGKTTLLASHIEASRCHALWYQIDSGDSDPASFFYFLGLAGARAAPEAPPLPLLAPEYAPDLTGFGRRFFRALFTQLPDKALLVFDNVQDVEDIPALQSLMRVLVDELPPGMRLAFLSRNPPPPALARFTANRRMSCIGWDELRLTASEAGSLLGPDHDPRSVARLHELTQGWAAGLLLLRDLDNDDLAAAAQAPGGGSLRVLFDYFASEIFAAASPELRRLLLRTAYFPGFTGAMARAASGLADAGDMLDRLAREHFFVGRLSDSELGYQYHALFRDFLRALNHAEGTVTAAKRDAAAILASHGRPEDAVALFIEVGDHAQATALVLRLAPLANMQGRWQTLSRWIDALPATQQDDAPWLLFWRGVADFATDPPAGRLYLERAHERFVAAGDIVGQWLACSGVMDASFLEWSEFHALDRWIATAESLWERRGSLPSPAHEIRVVTSTLAAMAYRQPQHPLLPVAAQRIIGLIDLGADPNQQAFSLTQLLQYFYWMADFGYARQVQAISQRLVDEGRLTPLNEVWARIMIAHGQCIQGQHEPAIANLELAYELARGDGLGLLMGVICLARTYTELSAGNLAEARRQIARAEAWISPRRLMDVALLQALRSWLALHEDRGSAAIEQAELAVATADATGAAISQVWSRSTLALALADAGHEAAAWTALNAADAPIARLDDGLFRFHIELIRADLSLRGGDGAEGLVVLRRALRQGARAGYADNIEWLPRMMSRLCTVAIRAGIEPDYVRMLIVKRRLKPAAENIDDWPWPVAIRVLGRFEVLRDGEAVEFPRKTPKKPIALLKALLALGGDNVAEGRLTDLLWADSEADAAQEALTVALHRLRKLLGRPEAIVVRNGRIGLNREVCWVDAWVFERLTERDPGDGEDAIALYRGDFLAGEDAEHWIIPMRERLHARFVRHVGAAAAAHRQAGRHDAAMALYHRGMEIDELAESFYQDLMRCHLELGSRAEGLAVYRRLCKVLADGHGLRPAVASNALAAALRNR